MKWCFHLAVWIDSYKSIWPSHPPMLRILHDIESGVSWHRHALHETPQAVLAICVFFFFSIVFLSSTYACYKGAGKTNKYASVRICLRHNTCYTAIRSSRYCWISELFRAHPLTHFYSSCFSFFAFLCSSFRPCLLKMYCKIPFRCRGIHAQSVTPQPMP